MLLLTDRAEPAHEGGWLATVQNPIAPGPPRTRCDRRQRPAGGPLGGGRSSADGPRRPSACPARQPNGLGGAISSEPEWSAASVPLAARSARTARSARAVGRRVRLPFVPGRACAGALGFSGTERSGLPSGDDYKGRRLESTWRTVHSELHKPHFPSGARSSRLEAHGQVPQTRQTRRYRRRPA